MEWSFGDGTTSSEQNPTKQFNAEGEYVVKLRVWDSVGHTAVIPQIIVVGNKRPVADAGPTIGIETDDSAFPLWVRLNGGNSYDPDGQIVQYYWQSSSYIPNPYSVSPYVYVDAYGGYQISLTVTDDDFATDSDTTYVSVWAPGNDDNDIYPNGNMKVLEASPIMPDTGAPGVIIINASNMILNGLGTTFVGNGSGICIYNPGFDNVTIANFTISNYGVGIKLENCSNNLLTEINVSNNVDAGILMAHSSNNTIAGNVASDNEEGILLKQSNCNFIADNTVIHNNANGIGLGSMMSEGNCSGNTIAFNDIRINGIESFGSGVCLDRSSNNLIMYNNITLNGLPYGGKGIFAVHSNGNRIRGNNISNNTDGTWITDFSSENIVECNIVACNGLGVLIQGDKNEVHTNVIDNNTVGLGISKPTSRDNTIYHNSFIDNTRQAYDEGENTFDSGYPFGGNHWSHYTVEDANGDGIGDRPYIIDNDSQDRYPIISLVVNNITIMNVTASKSIVGQGYPVNVTVTVKNNGSVAETFNVTLLTYSGTTTVIGTENISLTNGNSATITFTWNTTGLAKGNYTISTYATPVPGETDTLDNSRLAGGTIYVGIPGDVNADRKVDMKDIGAVAKAFGSTVGHPRYNPNYDINFDGKIDMKDIGTSAKNFGKTNT